MKSFLLALVFFLITSRAIAQIGDTIVNKKDAKELIRTWNYFKQALVNKDLKKLRLLSCEKVVGEYLFEPISATSTYKPYISNRILLANFIYKLYPQVTSTIDSNNYKIVKDKEIKGGNKTQYQIWFTHKSTPGYQLAFIFIKYNETFKFYGLTSIP